jgi:hypothetical protein
MPSWPRAPGSRRGKGRFESGPARLWRTSKLDRRLTFPFGVGERSDDDGEGSGRGDGGGELELLTGIMDMETRGVR